jgi:hypothetical protein
MFKDKSTYFKKGGRILKQAVIFKTGRHFKRQVVDFKTGLQGRTKICDTKMREAAIAQIKIPV